MIPIKFIVGNQTYLVEIPESLIDEGDDFFAKINQDMDQGWQMSRTWVDRPDNLQRCQIVADKVLTALHKNNREMVQLSAAYILKYLPGVTHADIDIDGDITQTNFSVNDQPLPSIN